MIFAILSSPHYSLAQQNSTATRLVETDLGKRATQLLAADNLVAWCIVPFDAAKRTPAQRAAMLVDLGLTRCAYDWRAEHVAEFEQEILEYKKSDIDFFAFWDQHPDAFKLFEKYSLHPAIWLMIPDPGEMSQENRVQKAIAALQPVAQQTKKLGCQLSLYNHGGWAGQPDNMIAVADGLRKQGFDHVGIVWNLHHGHDFIANWPAIFQSMLPYLHCININGMNDNAEPKILPLGQGQHEFEMLKVILQSDYNGRIGILDHREDIDSRIALQQNLTGLKTIVERFQNQKEPLEQNPTTDQSTGVSLVPKEFSADYVDQLVAAAKEHGSTSRGVQVFAANRFACLSCHKIDQHGGTVGPGLTEIANGRSIGEIASSILWPNHLVEAKYQLTQVLTVDGLSVIGVKQNADDEHLELLDPATGKIQTIAIDDVDGQREVGSSMPSGIADAMTFQQQADLVLFLSQLGKGGDTYQEELRLAFAHSHPHESRPFPYQQKPLHPEFWPNHIKQVNRQRVYDFYAQQANYYRGRRSVPLLLEAYPGLDGPDTGHWGNQDENTWRDGRWNEVVLDTVLAGVTRLGDRVINRGVNVQLSENEFACFDINRLQFTGLWSGNFLSFSDVRHGFMDALKPGGDLREMDAAQDSPVSAQTLPGAKYLGMYRDAERVAFAYQIDEQVYLDSLASENGEPLRILKPLAEHPWNDMVNGGRPRWPQVFESEIKLGHVGGAYEVDSISFPKSTPWNVLFFASGLDFLPDGSAMVSTMQGDVWHVQGITWQSESEATSARQAILNSDQNAVPMAQVRKTSAPKAKWRRFAAGLNQPLGVKIINDKIFVQCRDQLLELQDLNNDGEADFYRCVNKAFETSPAGHDYICGLQADHEGNFYTASGNQGLLKLSADGTKATVLATGFRNPDGLGLLPDGTLTVPCSEGDWTPASKVCAVNKNDTSVPHFGYQGPKNDQPPSLPLFYMPRGLDNSSGEQVWCDSAGWGPLKNQLVHMSFGMGRLFYVMRDAQLPEVQAAVVPLPGDFDSGIHRGRFNPVDGQLYVAGMTGWGSYTPEDGCLQRMRYTGKNFTTPVSFKVHRNGIWIQFNRPVDSEIASQLGSHFVQSWNYRYSSGYGSPELSAFHPGLVAHDSLAVLSANVLGDGSELFLEIPDIQATNQIQVNMLLGDGAMFPEDGVSLFVTVHQLADEFASFPGFQHRDKIFAAHPQASDLISLKQSFPNPFANKIPDARVIKVETGKNLTFQTTLIEATAGEAIQLTLSNPDVVPHNWVLIRPGTLATIGDQANRLIADPAAVARQYIPESNDVLAYTDIVDGNQEFTIYFNAPTEPGSYPFLCTFPGHWMVMNGILKVNKN